MANYANLKAQIDANIYQNDSQAITGAIMNTQLKAMVDVLGAGYQFIGVATPSTNPGEPDQKVFYLASLPGAYTNFGGLNVWEGETAVLKFDSGWTKSSYLDSVVRLAKIGPAGNPTDLSVGDIYFAGTPGTLLATRVLAISGGQVTHYEQIPMEKNTLYIVGDTFYKWNGSALVVSSTVAVTEYGQCAGNNLAKINVGGVDHLVKDIYFDESYGLKQGYQLDGNWLNDTTRVSTKMINGLDTPVRVLTTGNIRIAGYTKRDANYNFVEYVSASSSYLELSAGYYYCVTFKDVGSVAAITPADVAGKVYVGNAFDILRIKESIQPFTDFNLEITEVGIWYVGTTIGGTLTTSAVTSASVIKSAVAEGEVYQYSGTGGSGGRAWYLLDSSDKVVAMAASSFVGTQNVTIPAGVASILAQSTTQLTLKRLGGFTALVQDVDALEDRIDDVELEKKYDSFKAKSSYLWNKLSRLKNGEEIFANIGFIGDSWTQGTQNIIGGVSQGDYQGYVRPLTKMLQDEYGFGGLGWLDFARDYGTSRMFGCAEMYEHWSYQFTGDVTGLDGSTSGEAVNCLGICCAHTIFGNGATLALSFNAGYLDVFKLRYYKGAHFTVSINGGAAVEVTADTINGWQETTFGTTGTDITSVLITSLADNTIIFGMDCFYGVKGVRCHKIGNRSISAAAYLAMNETQWEQGISLLGLDWVSVMLAINDLGTGTDPSRMATIVSNIASIIGRAKDACTVNSLVVCDVNVLGIECIENAGWVGLPALAAKQRQFALENGYGWSNSAIPVGKTPAEVAYMGTFSDQIHLNVYGSYAYAAHIYNDLFTF